MNIEEINGAIKEIADNFKNPSQQLKLIEELGELSRELSKDIAVGRNISTATISEIVDVAILIEQILYLAEEGAAELAREQLEYKLQRTLERIEEGYYENKVETININLRTDYAYALASFLGVQGIEDTNILSTSTI